MLAPDLTAVAAGVSASDVYGLLRLAGAELAVPLSVLREVVPRPAELATLPMAAPGLLGALRLRALVVPVVDLRPRLGLPVQDPDEQVVVVVAEGGHLLGIVADEVVGIATVPHAERLDVRTSGARAEQSLFPTAFRSTTSEGVVSVLDAAALLALPDLPAVRIPDAPAPAAGSDTGGAGTGAAGTAASARRKLTVVQCGSYVLGLDSVFVHMLIPAVSPTPSVLDSALCWGVTPYADLEVAVVDPLQLLGLGELPPDDVSAGLVLELGTGYVVLAVSKLLDLAEVPAADVLPLPCFSVQRGELLSGLLRLDPPRSQCLVLDGDALHAETELRALASLNVPRTDVRTAATTDDKAARTAALGRRDYLVYTAGTSVVTPLDQVAEIMPFPETSTPTGASPAVLGVVVHRQAAVPVLCLATLLGHVPAPSGPASCALVVHVDDEPVAFVVDVLRSIEPLTWEDSAPPVRRPADTPEELLQRGPLLVVGDRDELLHELDLRALVRMVRGPTTDGLPELPGQRCAAEVSVPTS